MEDNRMTAEHIISKISDNDTFDKYKDYKAAMLAGYMEHIVEINPDEVIKVGEVVKLLKWTFMKL